MRRSEASRYARWSAAAAFLFAGVTAAIYLQRGWVRHVEKKNAPPAAPRDVTRLSSGLTFSEGKGNQKIFTVEASKSTDFKDKDASLLEDVKITIFGKTGERHDTIHTQSCQYGKEKGDIICSGEVQIDLQSAADAERAGANANDAASKLIHVQTHGVTFDRSSGTAKTNEPVLFRFPDGSGEAVGVEYNTEEGTARLLKDVRMTLARLALRNGKRNNGRDALEESVQVKGTRMDFGRDSRTIHMSGPAEVETRSQRITAGELTLSLNTAFHAEKLLATAGAHGERPELTLQSSRGQMGMSAETLAAQFAPQGWVARAEAAGNVRGSRKTNGEEDDFDSDMATLDLWPKISQPKELNLSGSVSLQTQMSKTNEARTLRTTALRVIFNSGKEGEASKAQRAETLAPGSMEWAEAAPRATEAALTKVQADRLAMEFGAQDKARELQATGNVQMERTVPGHPVQTATAHSGEAQLLASGGWSQMDLHGGVRLKEGDRIGQAEHAVFQRAAHTAILTGQPVVRDATTETHAARITFMQSTGDIRAEGGVRSADFSVKGSAVQLAPAPVNITADGLQANSKTRRALYSGHARLWQGDAVLEADSIELLRETKVLNAAGNVRAVFPQEESPPGVLADAAHRAAKKSQLWHASAGTLSYWDAENRARLERNVTVQSAEQRIRAAALDFYFTRSAVGANGANTSAGAQQISRAMGTGGVIVEQAGRRATAECGEYTASGGKFVMSGGNPTLYDGASGTTTGRQLTFFLADDTIIVDSENGSRTLTKHRVEK
jgi:LPS export ABC transporter protein LptC/lipopolysaccharide transport protein LptA